MRREIREGMITMMKVAKTRLKKITTMVKNGKMSNKRNARSD